jgi:uncharacterized membrane protein HdeD (DUF308 family)
MDAWNIVFGGTWVAVGAAGLVKSFSFRHHRSFVERLLCFTFGAALGAYGTIHFAEGTGAQWATPQLRQTLFPWFATPCTIALIIAWIMDRKRSRTHF